MAEITKQERPVVQLRVEFPHQWSAERSAGTATIELRDDGRTVRVEVLENPYVQPMEFDRYDWDAALAELFGNEPPPPAPRKWAIASTMAHEGEGYVSAETRVEQEGN